MKRVEYFEIIHRYIPPNSSTYPLYMIHCQLVANKALTVARKLGLSDERMQFIEEAAMLHDIGIFKTDAPSIGCTGTLPYICHLVEGAKILEAEGLPRHARVAERHASTGLTQEEIEAHGLPLPPKDLIPETVEEEVISYADFFYSKLQDTLWQPKSLDAIRRGVARHGEHKLAKLEEWITRFE